MPAIINTTADRDVLVEALDRLHTQALNHPETTGSGDEEIRELRNRLTSASFDSAETYAVMAVSTAHLSPGDRNELAQRAMDACNNMVMARDTGFFIKLFQGDTAIESVRMNDEPAYSDGLRALVIEALKDGVEMIELDADAAALARYPVHE